MSLSIPTTTIERKINTITLGELFELNEDGEPIRFNSNYDEHNGGVARHNSKLQYRIPEHQRYPSWPLEKKRKLVDTVFKNYTMSGFVLSQHIDLEEGEIYYDFEDGQSRASVLQEYYNGGFSYKQIEDSDPEITALYYDDLTHVQKRKFDCYAMSLEILSKIDTKSNDIQEMFERLQEGKPLDDADKYWNRKTTFPLVEYAHTCLTENSHIINEVYMKPNEYSHKNRKRLGDLVGFISGIISTGKIINSNGDELDIKGKYITTCFKSQCLGRDGPGSGKLETEITDEQKEEIETFFEYYYNLIDKIYDTLPLRNKEDDGNSHRIWNILQQSEDKDLGCFKKKEQMKKWYSLTGSEGGMILWDYLNDSGKTIEEKMDMWVEMINYGRTHTNFLTGNKSLFSGLSGADTRNTFYYNYKTRIARVYEFYDNEKRHDYCAARAIKWCPINV